MRTKEQNDLLYVSALIEYTGRKMKLRNADLVKIMGKKELAWQLEYADVSHCMSFEETSDELIEKFNILTGDFDSEGMSEYEPPHYIAIAGVYSRLIDKLITSYEEEAVDIMYKVFTSFISDEISNFNTSTFYENPSFIYHSYLKGELLND